MSHWMKFSFTVENIKMGFTSQHMNVPQYKQGCSAAAVKKRVGRLLKLPPHSRHWTEACQYVLCIEHKWPLEGKCISLFFFLISPPLNAVFSSSHFRGSNPWMPITPRPAQTTSQGQETLTLQYRAPAIPSHPTACCSGHSILVEQKSAM